MSGGKRSAPLTATPQIYAPVRLSHLDGFRGVAVLLMMLDHAVLVFSGPQEVRWTLGRLAMPMFFVLAGVLASRPRWRHLWIAVAGFALPIFVPWIDDPNVLVLWALGSVSLWLCVWGGIPRWLLAAVGLTFYANGYTLTEGGYEPAALYGLMALGSMLPRSSFAWALGVPEWVKAIGRTPVRWYLGHLLLLQGLVLTFSLRF